MTTYRLEIPDEKWNQFKDTLSKNQNINQVIEDWIDQHIDEVTE
jgi:lauroyl/myristoyl acyltransferase